MIMRTYSELLWSVLELYSCNNIVIRMTKKLFQPVKQDIVCLENLL